MKLNLTQSTLTQVGDYCTGWFDGWWGYCCKVHDDQYAAGAVKWAADVALGICVATSGTEWWQIVVAIFMGLIMLTGVTLFGSVFYNRALKNKRAKEDKTL